jgi:hypothetical protein
VALERRGEAHHRSFRRHVGESASVRNMVVDQKQSTRHLSLVYDEARSGTDKWRARCGRSHHRRAVLARDSAVSAQADLSKGGDVEGHGSGHGDALRERPDVVDDECGRHEVGIGS